MRDQKPEVRNALSEKKDLDDDITRQVEASIAEFQPQFTARKAQPAATVRA
jgi:hypothetical protein